jgi:DNA-binding SARP family transcriptional activator
MLSLALLGPFQAARGDGSQIEFRTHKEQALLAFLAVEASRPHRREALAEFLWPERPEGVARTSLRQALAGLRRAISRRHLLTTRTTVQFNVAADHWLDLAVYDAHWQAIRKHIHDDPATCPICMGHRQQAVALYRGDFLAGLVLDDSREFQEWVTVHRERFFRRQVQSLEQLARYRFDLGDLARARRYARRWVELDPLSERAHRQRMALLALSGRRHEALAQYEACREVLSEELEMEPGPETAALQERIRERKMPPVAEHPPASPLQNLPANLTPFVGRQSELAYLRRLLSKPECRLLSVVGPGGVGKSRLALRAAEGVHGADTFADGV